MSVKNGNEVRVEKIINRSAKDVFQSLAEGRLFNNCGTAMEHMKIDFKVGGAYQLGFHNASSKLCGRFTEIVPDRKICFTWGDEGSDKGFPMSDVSIELFADGGKTRVVIQHKGFKTKEEADAHDHGWTTGLNDLSSEIVDGCTRLVRVYPVSRAKLYETCSDLRKFFAGVTDTAKGELDFRVGGQYRFPTKKGEILGKFEEIVPGQKIVFSWLSGCDKRFEKPTRVTLAFDDEDDGESSLELVHELLPHDSVKSHREGWECVTAALFGLLNS